ncbi:MAG TPA: hypothetical protein IAB01_00765 [Candidatus Avidesulfovibrio excrementigallinarum]|nr:hypothetical protein [Candidatus Avidesulfovibrio excrementigallinarum]
MDVSDNAILTAPLVAVAAGVDMFAESLEEQGVTVQKVDWRPPSEAVESVLRFLPFLDD